MTARTDLLAAQLRTARTKAERRSAASEFMSAQAPAADVMRADREFRHWFNTATDGLRVPMEARAASEGTNSAGGYLVKPGFASSVIYFLKEYQGFIADCEELVTSHGEAWKRPQVSSFVASGASVSENTQLTDSSGTGPVFPGQQSFSQTPEYPVLLRGSFQLFQDGINQDDGASVTSYAGLGLGEHVMLQGADIGNVSGYGKPVVFNGLPGGGPVMTLLAAAAAQSIGRQVASAASTAIYGAATTGQEVSLTSAVTNANIAKLPAKLDPAFYGNASLYVSPADYSALLADDAVKLAHYPFPVVVTNAATNWATGTVSGPVLANLGAFMTMRRVDPMTVMPMNERYADLAQFGLAVALRADFAATGQATAAVFSK